MEKAIYGLAMPFNEFYWNYTKLTNTYELELTNYGVTQLWKAIQLTIDHDRSKILGTTEQDLFVKLHPSGVYFKMVSNTPESFKAYQDVKDGLLRHCSITYLRRMERDYDEENKVISLARVMNWNHNFIVKKHTEVLIDEMCLTNSPGNKATFCTTDKNDPRLKGVRWG
jgi:hypothetical protein